MSTRRTSGRRTGWRIWGAVALSVTAAVGLSVWQLGGDARYPGRLDPQNPGPDGAQAIARVLEDQGVDVRIARSADELSGELAGVPAKDPGRVSVVVTSPSALAASTTDRLINDAGAAPIIVIDPDQATLSRLDPAATPVQRGRFQATAGDCGGPAPLTGLRLSVDEATTYSTKSDTETATHSDTGSETDDGCFPAEDGGSALVRLGTPPGQGAEDAGGGVWAFGAGAALSNDEVLRDDNAAVALRLLGQSGTLVWYVPDPADATAEDPVGLVSLLPRGTVPAVALVALALIAWIAARGRRFGPLSSEPLPVAVRAVETTRARGRMYRRTQDRGHAATALRARAARTLAGELGLHRPDPDTLIAAVAARTTERHSPSEIAALLDGAPPSTDADLIRLAQDLDHLTREIR